MTISAKILVLPAIILTLLAIIVTTMFFNYNNAEIDLRFTIEAQQETNSAYFDNMWVVIQQQAQVADRYKESFQEVYREIMDARYNQEERTTAMFNFLKESNPEFDSSVFSNLMSTIEAQRNSFLQQQRRLIDLKREHDSLVLRYPSRWFVSNKETIEITIVTTQRTRDTFDSGIEEDINIF